MSDWLLGDDDTDTGGYLGMDEPAMPDAAPAPPSAPTATADSMHASDDWLGAPMTAAPHDAPVAGHTTGAAVMDDQGDWLGGPAFGADEPAAVPHHAAPHPPHQQQPPAVAATAPGDISVLAPVLQQVQPTRRPATGDAAAAAGAELSTLVLDVEVQIEVGLGNAALTVEEFLDMGRGSVVELDTPVDAPIELKVRGKVIARGQLVSINGSYGMRITEMLNEEH